MNQTSSVAHSAGTSAFGAALAIVVGWLVSATGHIMPTDVTVALGVVFTSSASFALSFIPQKEPSHA